MTALGVAILGCGQRFFPSRTPPVRIDPLTARIECPDLRAGAELVLLADQSPVQLSVQVSDDPFGATPEISPVETSCQWSAAVLSSPAMATGEFQSPATISTVWSVPPAGGLFRIRCVVRTAYSAPSGRRFTGAAVRTAARSLVVSGTGELLVEVPTPANRMVDGVLDGVPLGVYPDPLDPEAKPIVRQHVEAYRTPAWFYRIDRKNRDLRVSPDFTLGDFDMTYDYWQPDYAVPYEYIALHPRLIEKLDLIAGRVRAALDPKAKLVLLAGYRSPSYNEGVKRAEIDSTQTAQFSMHLYGRAADFIIDNDSDGRMDDINHDGKIDINDARVVRDIVDRIDAENSPGRDSLLGGCGVYPRHDIAARQIQTPYIHVDVRGYFNGSGKPIRWEMN